MNELSWLIYLAGVFGSLGVWCILGAVLMFAVCIVALVFPVRLDPEMASWLDRNKDYQRWPSITTPPGDKPEPKPIWDRRPLMKFSAVMSVVMVVVSIVTPSSNTMYAIAASEVGERVITSETGGKAIEALNVWLDAQINKGAEKKETN